jgi:hypothetical protein
VWCRSFLMQRSTPAMLASLLTLCEAQSWFHGTACTG